MRNSHRYMELGWHREQGSRSPYQAVTIQRQRRSKKAGKRRLKRDRSSLLDDIIGYTLMTLFWAGVVAVAYCWAISPTFG